MTAQAPASETATTSSESGGTSACSTEVTSTSRGPRSRTASTAASTSSSVVVVRAGEEVELEVVGREDVGLRDHGVAHELGDPGPHEHAAADVAHHRVAAVDRGRVGRLHRARPRRGSPRPPPGRPGSRTAPRRTRRARRGRRSRRSPRGRRPGRAAGRATRRTRCGWRSARSAPARPRGRAAAAGRPPPSCRRGRRPPRTGSTGSSRGAFCCRADFRPSPALPGEISPGSQSHRAPVTPRRTSDRN